MSNEKHCWQYLTRLILLVLNNFTKNELITKRLFTPEFVRKLKFSSVRSLWTRLNININNNSNNKPTIFFQRSVTRRPLQGRGCPWRQIVSACLSVFRRNIFPFSRVEPFGYDNAPDEGTVTFYGKIWGNFPISPKTGGRGDESNHVILKLRHTPNCS